LTYLSAFVLIILKGIVAFYFKIFKSSKNALKLEFIDTILDELIKDFIEISILYF